MDDGKLETILSLATAESNFGMKMGTSPFVTADTTVVRDHNLSHVLNLLRQHGPLSRAALVRQTGLSATTISSLVNVLLESGFVREAGTGQSSGGRPPILLQFNYKYRHVVGVDMGATHLAVVLMDLGGEIVSRRYQIFDVAHDPRGALDAVVEMVFSIIAAAALPAETVLGVGLAVPAPLEGEGMDRLSDAILPAWKAVDLVSPLEKAIGLPVYVDNDANAGAMAEKWWGQGQRTDNLAYIKLGTGVGGGLIVHGQIYRGEGGTAGEIGHTTIDLSGPRCRCGKYGCLESFVGAPAVIREVQRRRQDETPLTLTAVSAAAHAGEPVARAVIEESGRYLGIAIANLLNLLNPGLIVLGGEMTAAGDVLLAAVRAAVARRAMPKAAREARIVLSELGHDVVAIGVATLVIQHASQPQSLWRTLHAG
jgi:glucokinase-like ROK family protein